MKPNKSRRALVMLFGDPSCDPRPRRMIHLLHKQGYVVDVVSNRCVNNLPISSHFLIEYSNSISAKIIRRIIHYIRKFTSIIPGILFKDTINNLAFGVIKFDRILSKLKYELIVVEDIFLLPLAMKIKQGAKLIFDAREYYPAQNEDSFWWRLFERPERIRLCKRYLNECDYVLTVSPGLAKEYEKGYGIKAIIYRSVPFYVNRSLRKTDTYNIKLVHHGVANPNRRLEKMIDVLRQLDTRFSLDMYLTGSSSHINYLKNYSKSVPNIRICDPVAFDDINTMLGNYDIGLFYNEPLTYNLRYSLPNKLFEFIQARLAVAVSPSPDMADIVRLYRCGIVANNYSISDMAEVLNSLTPEAIDLLKKNANLAAKELSFEVESQILINILNSIEYNE